MNQTTGRRPWYRSEPLLRLDRAGKRLDSWPLAAIAWVALSVGPAWVGLRILNDETVAIPLLLRILAWALVVMSLGTFLFFGRLLTRDFPARQKTRGGR